MMYHPLYTAAAAAVAVHPARARTYHLLDPYTLNWNKKSHLENSTHSTDDPVSSNTDSNIGVSTYLWVFFMVA